MEVSCTHCSLPVPRGLIEEGANEQFCCAGCRTVYETLQGAGLQRFYELSEQTNDAPPRQASTSGRGFTEFDHEDFLARYVDSNEEGFSQATLYLEGVHCAACVWLVEKLPTIVPGVLEARLDIGRAIVTLSWRTDQVALSVIARTLDRLGYPPHPLQDGEEQQQRRKEARAALLRIGVAGALAGNVMGIAFALYGGYLQGMEQNLRDFFRWSAMLLTLVSLLWPGRVFFRGAWASLRTRTPHMDLPIAIGIGAGFFGGAWHTITGTGEVYFESVAVLVFLLLVGRHVQSKQQRRAYEAMELLHALTPGTARRNTGSGFEEVPILSLQKGDQVEVRGAETAPADGTVVEGESSFDMAVLSGETRPIAVQQGGRVFAGTLNLGARVVLEVDSTGADSRVGRLLQLVEQHAKRPAAIVRVADRISGVFTVVVLLLAAITGLWWSQSGPDQALENAIALLIVACPCALGLATPLAVVAAVGRAARSGILVKGGDALERLASPGILVLDKTGTLTQGAVSVVQWHGESKLQAAVAALEEHASHPFAGALVEFGQSQAAALESAAVAEPQSSYTTSISTASGAALTHPIQVEDVEAIPGKGVRGKVNGQLLCIGAPAWIAEQGADLPPEWITQVLDRALSPVAILQTDSRGQITAIAMAGIGDAIQPDAPRVVAELQEVGWQLQIMSGDHPQVVAAVAAKLGMEKEHSHGGLSPEQKLAAIEELRAQQSQASHSLPVLMVGDGWNDAAALAAADVGIAVHGSAEASLAAADVFLSAPGLGGVAGLLEGAKRTVRVIRRNLAVSLAYNGIGVALAMTGVLNPLLAAVLMPVSSLTVVSVAWRSRTFT
ncbi:MAG: heavy metal translocating P-type ATPase [Planctomycetes bacterium]|nr:heavy metal translocating P-type ATPase [Planctomycetota bacterium]MCP4770480.1 heavy metal translocating P-type ATPase [Planctomycetota bacterium]MCP4859920.1 heavy metal translocating P-type ATPase [Planctomycetota bacterium]